jgi:ADP-ribose pyrophosphatase YjhB (NUDIX family)
MASQQRYLDDLTAMRAIRTTVRAIIRHDDHVLVQRPSDDPDACYGFIGGRVELGESLEDRLRKELDEEVGARVASLRYLFFVENRFLHGGGLVHLHEHFFGVELTRYEVSSRESHLVQSWLPLGRLASVDLRPHVVRDAIVTNDYVAVRHLIVPL